MRWRVAPLVGLLLVLSAASFAAPRQKLLMDFNWKFHLGNAADPQKDFGFGTGAPYAKSGYSFPVCGVGFADAGWRTINVPHDWGIETPFNANADNGHGSHELGGDFPSTTVGWYRKTFTIPADDLGKKLTVEFGGVFRDCHVWLNGHLLGRHRDGYTSFRYDITDVANYGGTNALVVRVDVRNFEGWWYEGAGIYRHVYLLVTNPVHLRHNGVVVRSTPVGTSAKVVTYASVDNESGATAKVRLHETVIDPKRGQVASFFSPVLTIAPYSSATWGHSTSYANPSLWSCDEPNLCHLRTDVISVNDTTEDQETTEFGVRSIRFDPNKGFFLNGKRVEIKGFCNHQDAAGVGIAIPDSLWAYRIAQLKKYGANALRFSHNPRSQTELNLCDKMGILVMDETRLMDSTPAFLKDLKDMVATDRNHPSIILWSLGNEEGIASTITGKRIFTTMKRVTHEIDPTRPTTWAGNNGGTYFGANEVVDVRGWNYDATADVDKYHAAHPDQPEFGSEQASSLGTRGEYANDPQKGFMAAYDINQPGWGNTAESWWKFYDARPFLAGGYVWTGFDYRGEPTPYGWPDISSEFGILDTCGFPKDIAYYYKAWWSATPTLHLFPHWNWPGKEGKPVQVWAFANCQQVELFVNGVSAGKQEVPKDGHLEWTVNYQPGKIEAVGYTDGKKVLDDVRETTGKLAKLQLVPYRKAIEANGQDVEIFKVEGVDDQGRVVPTANAKVQFHLEGDAKILGVGNGDPTSHEPDTFFSEPTFRDITRWQMASVPMDMTPVASAASGTNPHETGVRNADQIRDPNTAAVFSTTFNVGDDISKYDHLAIGQLDDLGWVFLNGTLLGTTNDWNKAYAFDIKGILKPGNNELVVWVRNQGGSGGLGSVSLSGPSKPVMFSRSLFNGLAQVIVQSGMTPGEFTLVATSPGIDPANSTISMLSVPIKPFVP